MTSLMSPSLIWSSRINVKEVRKEYYNKNGSCYNNLPLVVECLNEWRNQTQYISFKVTDKKTGKIEYKYIQASKRGNDMYRIRVKNRFKSILDICKNNPNVRFIIKTESGKLFTNCIKMTLVVDANRYIPITFNGKQISRNYDNFIKRLKRIYPDAEICRTYEVSENGLLHINVIIFFKKIWIEVFFHHSKKTKKTSYRIKDYSLKERLNKLWDCGYSDIRAIENTKDLLEYSLKYQIKYFTKEENKKKQDLTNSVLSLFNKRGFSIPNSFVSAIESHVQDYNELFFLHRRGISMHNSPQFENKDKIYKFLGVYSAEDLGITENILSFSSDKPPPFMIYDVETDDNTELINLSYNVELMEYDWRKTVKTTRNKY